MLGVYFSGTGNTKHCVEFFVRELDQEAPCVSIEDSTVLEKIKKSDVIIFGYPIYVSNLPKIVRDFIDENKGIFNGKRIYIIATMGLFSGDGTGCSARIFMKYGAEVIGGLHLRMPDCISDVKLLKKPMEKNKATIKASELKIKRAADKLKDNNPDKEGLGFLYHMAGLFGQRLWFYNQTMKYTDKLKINKEKCVGCGVCIKVCPMENLSIAEKTVHTKGKCTMCYRCINNCPNQAITLLGKKVGEQSRIEKYL